MGGAARHRDWLIVWSISTSVYRPHAIPIHYPTPPSFNDELPMCRLTSPLLLSRPAPSFGPKQESQIQAGVNAYLFTVRKDDVHKGVTIKRYEMGLEEKCDANMCGLGWNSSQCLVLESLK